MKKLSIIDERANTAGLVFGILFSLIIIIMTAFPFGIGLNKEAYIHSAIFIIYPIGLFIGLKWKGPGIIICLVSMIAYMVANFISLPENFTFPSQFIVFWTVLILIQLLPATLYVLAWYYHRQSQKN